MPDESDPNLTRELQGERAPVDGSNRPNATPSARSHTWGRTDRIRLLIWVGIAFLLPGACVLRCILRPGGGGSAFTLQRELPATAIMASFVSWRPGSCPVWKNALSTITVFLPNRHSEEGFGRGSAWGFAMLSAILLVLRVPGHFRIDSVALRGNEVFWYAFAWAPTFLAVSFSEEFAFRGYWLATWKARCFSHSAFVRCSFGSGLSWAL